MKLIFLLFIIFMSIFHNTAQTIRKIAAYDNYSSSTSGLFCITDHGIYRYSWYYHQWIALPKNGLPIFNNNVNFSALAAYNNKITNSSGIFVFSDSAVFNYNWFSEYWYSLKNTGLPRNSNNKPDVIDLAVYGDSGSSSNSSLFALTNSGIYLYNWYAQKWIPLSNDGISSFKKLENFENFHIQINQNPINDNSSITIILEKDITNEKISFVYLDANGKFLLEEKITYSGKIIKHPIPTNKLPKGIIFCEILTESNQSMLKLIKL